MKNSYNRIAGHSVERLAALSDGLFAVAMTLTILDIHLPEAASIHSEGELWAAISALAPRFIVYLMSFLTLGIFWVGQQTQLNHLARSDRDLSWLHLAFLFTVTLVPVSTMLLTGFLAYRVALLIYWGNILLMGTLLFLSWRHACRRGLFQDSLSDDTARAVERRILIAQGLYGLGAALCVFNTYWSLGFILLVQLNYALAPRLPTRPA